MLKKLSSFLLNKINENKKILLYLTLYILVFAISFRILGNNCLQLNNDNLYQYEIFYKEWIEIVNNFFNTGKLNTFSFDLFLGTDFYSSMMNCIGDVFFPIVLLFKDNVSIGLIIETILCIYVSSIAMSSFLRYKGIKNNNVILFISLIYAIGGQATLMLTNIMFHRFYAFLPFLFLATEYYLKERKTTPFIVVNTILFISNYYLMYMSLVFLFFYTIVECISNNLSFKTILKYFFCLLGAILIGFLISCFFILPSLFSIFGNAASRGTNNYLLWEINSIFGIFSSIIIPSLNNVIPTIFNLVYDSHGSGYNLFITLIPFGFILLNIANKENKKRNILLILLFVVAIIKPFNLFFHPFVPSLRWTFLLNYYLLYLSSIYMDMEYNKQTLFKYLIGIVVVNILLIVILYLCGYVKSNMNIHIMFLTIGLIINIIIAILFRYTQKIAYILSIGYIFGTTIFAFNILNSHNYIQTLSKSEIDYNQNYESTYYRYYNSYKNTFDGSELDANSSILYNIMSTSTYCSSYDTNINKFIQLTDSVVSLEQNIEISDHDALTMLGTKYYIVGDRIKDKYSNTDYLEYAYSLKDLSKFDVYNNKDYRGFGYCAENVDYINNYGKEKDKTFINTLFVDDDSADINKYQNISYSPLDVKYMGDNYVYAEINNSEDNILLIPFPNNKGWNITVNGIKANPISVNGGFIGLEINKGFNEIEMRFSTPYLKTGAMLSAVGIILFIIVFVQEKRKKA